MIDKLIHKWIPNADEVHDPAVRKAYGTCSSLMGIGCNLLLFIIKMIAGSLSGSIAITSDAFNNLSDCANCLVTLFGYKMASKPADKEHPFGHGRIEYFTTLIMALLIAFVGLELLKSAIEKLIEPEEVTFQFVTLFILLVSIAVKAWMMHFNTVLGDKISSSALLAVARDSRNDMIATASTVIALISSMITDFPVDGLMGIFVSLFILKSAIDMIRETMDDLLGKPADHETVEAIRERILSYPEVLGVHDLMLHDYGPGRLMGSCHVEVDGNSNFVDIHSVVDVIEHDIYDSMHILLTIHMDPVVRDTESVAEARAQVEQVVHDIDPALAVHDFRLVETTTPKRMVFDLAVPFSCPLESPELEETIQKNLHELAPEYTASMLLTYDYTA